MKNLLENTLQRHYKILKFLFFKGWLPTNSVAKQTGISDRTIQKDIGEINTYIAPAKIETSNKLGIRISYSHELNPSSIISSLYRQSIQFLILEEILLHQYTTINELADHLALSESTLKRKITQLNEELKPYDFYIHTKRLDIVGDEKKLCTFYYYYFYEKYGVLDALISGPQLQLLWNIGDEFFSFFKELDTPERRCFSYRNEVRFMLFILLKRLQRGHGLNISPDLRGFTLSDATKKAIHQEFGLKINDGGLYELFYVFFHEKYAWSMDDLNEKSTQNETFGMIKNSLERSLENIENKVNIKIPDKPAILLSLYNTLSHSWGPAKILYQASEEFFIGLNNYYELFTQTIKWMFTEELKHLPVDVFFDDSILNQLIFQLVTNWINLRESLENQAPTVKAGLLFNTSYGHTKFLMDYIRYHLKSRLTMENVDISTVSDLREKGQKFDMIITNLSDVVLKGCPIVSIHANPTVEDIATIISFYNQIIDYKVKNGIDLDRMSFNS